MSKLTSRLFSDPADMSHMVHLLRALRNAGQVVYPISTDLHEELANPAARSAVRLWENAAAELSGFCYVSSWQNLVDAFTASEFTPEIESEMIAWAVSVIQQHNRISGNTDTLDASTLETDRTRCELLERHGFNRQEESSMLMARRLEQPLPAIHLPDGFIIRPMGGEPELEAYVALHCAAFGTQHMTLEYRRSIMNAPGYLPELDLVAVAPGGELAAFCVCQIFSDDSPRAGGTREGWTDPVGTHPDFQRTGLAKTLMLAGMHLLKERGIDTVLMGTSSTNTAMRRTAESLGFELVSNTLWYSKNV